MSRNKNGTSFSLTAALILASIFGQNIAYAYDPVEYSMNTMKQNPVLQWFENRINTRFNEASPAKQARILNRMEKRAMYLKTHLEKMSELTFSKRVQSLSSQTPENFANQTQKANSDTAVNQDDQDLMGSEEMPPLALAPVPAQLSAVSQAQVLQKLDSAIQRIEELKQSLQSSNSKVKENSRSPASSGIADIFIIAWILIAIICAALIAGVISLFFSPIIAIIVVGVGAAAFLVFEILFNGLFSEFREPKRMESIA